MGARLSTKLTLDSTQHNQSLNDAVKNVSKYKREVDSANKKLNDFSKSTSSVGSSISGMMNAFKSGDFMGFANSARSAATAIGALVPAAGSATTAVSGLGAAVTTALGPIGIIGAAIGAAIGITSAAIGKTEEFNQSIRGLSALTGVTGSTLDQMGNDAIDLSMKFGTAAKDIVDSMKMIGSQAPQLLTDLEGLKKVTQSAMVLEKASDGMTVQDTAKAITTVMNQMDVAASESDKIINSLAAGSQKGAADVLYLTTAIEKCGTVAKNSNMSYQQLVGAIETLAPKFSSADVAGTGLNAMLLKLTTQANDNFNPAVVGLEKALENLSKANLSAAQKLEMFGRGGLVAANTLIEGRDALKDMTESVTDTTTAYDQMETKQGSLAGMTNKLKASWDALMIAYGQSPQVKAVVAIIGLVIKGVTLLIQACTKMVQLWNRVWNEIGQVIVAVWENYIKPCWDAIVETVTNSAIYKAVVKIWTSIVEFIRKAIGKITQWWIAFKKMIGVKTEVKVPVNMEVKKPKGDLELPSNLPGTSKTKSSKVKIEYDTGSLDDLEAKLTALQKKLTSKNLSPIDVEKTNKEIEELKEKIEKKKIELGIKPKKGILEDIEDQISKLDAKIHELNPQIDIVKINELQVKKEALEKLKKDTEAAFNGAVVKGKKFESEGTEGSLKYAQDKISYYKQRIELEVEGTENYEYLSKQLREWTEKENIIRLKVEEDTSNLDKKSLEYISNKVSYFKAQLNMYSAESPEYANAIKELKYWTEKEQEVKLKVELDQSGAKTGSLKELETRISNLQALISVEVYRTPEYNRLKKELDALTKEENVIRTRMEIDDMSGFEKMQRLTDVFGGIDGVVGSISSLTEAIEQDANAWEILMGIINVFSNTLNAIQTVIEAVTMVQQLLGTATQETSAITTAAAAQETANAAQTATASATTIAAKSGEAIAEATASGAKMPFPLNLAAIAAGIAAVIAAFKMIGSFANGGIVQGRTTIGDYNLARVNAGEMILNQRQQNNLFRAIDQDKIRGGNGGLVGTVVKVKGNDFYLALSNLAKTKNKIGKNIYDI